MSIFAGLLLALGVADLARSAGRRRLLSGMSAGLLTLAAVAVLTDLLATPASAALVGLAGVSLIAWLTLSERALQSHRGGHLLALGALVVGLVLPLLLSGWTAVGGGWFGDWLSWAQLPWPTPTPERALLVIGLLAVQLSTGNVVVRLVLTSIGAMRPPVHPEARTGGPLVLEPQPSDELKGGRLLGPMERLFILGLGLAGQFTAAGMVIAAKGLIRWPELTAKSEEHPQADRRSSGIDAVTEYFLVGSFVSWLVALAALAVGRG